MRAARIILRKAAKVSVGGTIRIIVGRAERCFFSSLEQRKEFRRDSEI
jgi:hypothetical protein